MAIIRVAVDEFAKAYVSDPPPFCELDRPPLLPWAYRRWLRWQFVHYLSRFVANLVEAGIVQYVGSEPGEL